MPGQFSYGALAPIEHPTAYRFAAHPASAVVRPAQFDAFATYTPALRDQGQTGSCVGQTTAEVLDTLLRSPVALSAEMPWSLARRDEGTLGQNQGTYPHDALTETRNVGICTADLMPMSLDYNILPSADALTDALARTGCSFYQCNSLDELLTGMGTLGVPGLLAIAVYDAFETPDSTGVITGSMSGTVLGYHAITARLYSDTARRVRIRNHWRYGTGVWWGVGNEAYLSYAQLEQCLTECWIVTAPPRPVEIAYNVRWTAQQGGAWQQTRTDLPAPDPAGSYYADYAGPAGAEVQVTQFSPLVVPA